jgi:hypothetical protein
MKELSLAFLSVRFQHMLDQISPHDLRNTVDKGHFNILRVSIKDQLSRDFESEQKDIIRDLIDRKLIQYYQVFKRIDEETRLFSAK